MPQDVVIRPARAEEAAALADLRVALALEERAQAFSPDEYRQRCRVFFSRAVASGGVFAWLALAGSEPVGMAVLELRETLPRPRSLRNPTVDGRVRSVFVRPEQRGRGIGRALIREVIAAAQSARVDRLTLGASKMGVPMYEKLGFALHEREMIYRPELTPSSGADPGRR